MANVLEIAKRARAAALELSGVSEERKNAALARIAELLEQEAENIIAANSRDLEKAAAAGLSKPMLERLSLDRKKSRALRRACGKLRRCRTLSAK